MTADNGTLDPNIKDGAVAVSIEFKIPPDEILAGNMVQNFLEAGYDVSVQRVFSDTFDPPKIDHFLISLVGDVVLSDISVKGDE